MMKKSTRRTFIKAAGGSPKLKEYFEDDALIEVYNTTKGIPRDICILCDALFVNGYVLDQRIISPAVVERTVGEMAGAKRWLDILRVKRCSGSALSMPITES